MKLNGIDLNKLHVFTTVVEQKGYRAASERLGLSRSAISQSITSLEAQLGKPLFVRSGTRLIPTPAANLFYREILGHYRGLENAVDRLQGKAETAGGLLRVGAYLEFAKGKLMPAVEDFLSKNPRAQIQFHFDSPSRLERLLEEGRIELAVSIFPHRKKGVSSETLYEEELCLVGSKKLVSKRATVAELVRLPIIDYFPSHLLFKRWWRAHSKKPLPQIGVRAYAATAEMVLEMVERNLGIGVVPKYLLRGSSKDLVVIEPTPGKLIDHLWLSRKPNGLAHPLTDAFLASIRKTLL